MIGNNAVIEEVNALAYHPQPKNFISFAKRFFVHGMASRGIYELKSQAASSKLKMRSFYLINRSIELCKYYFRENRFTISDLLKALSLNTAAAIFWHLGSQYLKYKKMPYPFCLNLISKLLFYCLIFLLRLKKMNLAFLLFRHNVREQIDLRQYQRVKFVYSF